MEWAIHYMTLHAPIVLFTEEHLVPVFQAMRPSHLPLHIVVCPFEELETWSGDYPEKWREQHLLNPEACLQGNVNGYITQQTPELYAVWAHKPTFVTKAIHLNPFDTEFFFWCDIGAFRSPPCSQIQERFPETKGMMRTRILLQSVAPVEPHEKERQPDGLRGLPITPAWKEPRLVGGLWGGGKEACVAWKRACDAMRTQFFQAGRYAGNDQAVMLSVILEQPHLALVVKHHGLPPDGNPWFFMEYLLSSLAEWKVDVSYL
jgi:hypothetical protein